MGDDLAIPQQVETEPTSFRSRQSQINDLIIGSGVVADPRKFIWEATPLEAKGFQYLTDWKSTKNVK